MTRVASIALFFDAAAFNIVLFSYLRILKCDKYFRFYYFLFYLSLLTVFFYSIPNLLPHLPFYKYMSTFQVYLNIIEKLNFFLVIVFINTFFLLQVEYPFSLFYIILIFFDPLPSFLPFLLFFGTFYFPNNITFKKLQLLFLWILSNRFIRDLFYLYLPFTF
jgi:hypothetical protein